MYSSLIPRSHPPHRKIKEPRFRARQEDPYLKPKFSSDGRVLFLNVQFVDRVQAVGDALLASPTPMTR